MCARFSALLTALMLALAGPAAAQETTGAISGRIEDPQKLSVIDATVIITGSQGARTLVMDAEGRFTVAFLVPGLYAVRTELQGFKAAEARNISVSLGKTTPLNVTLEVGGLTETVEVTGVASGRILSRASLSPRWRRSRRTTTTARFR